MKTKSGKEAVKRREGWFPAALKGAGIGIAVTAALLVLFCLILSSTEDPGPLVVPLSLTALYLGGIAAGIMGAKRSKGGSLGGLFAGCVLAAAVPWSGRRHVGGIWRLHSIALPEGWRNRVVAEGMLRE